MKRNRAVKVVANVAVTTMTITLAGAFVNAEAAPQPESVQQASATENDLIVLEMNVAATKEELDKAIAEYDAASSSLKDAKVEAEKLRKAVEALETSQRRTAADYFAWVGSSGATYAYNVLTNPNFNAFLEYTHLGDKNDATDLDNMLLSLDFIDECNDLRASEGLPALRVSHESMAEAMANTNYAKVSVEHAKQYGAENLAFGYKGAPGSAGSPFRGWWDLEKGLLEAGETGPRTWHYLQIIHEYIDTTGFAISRGGTWSVTHGQQFSLVRDLWGEKPDSRVTYTVDEYRQSLLTYMSNASSPELQAAKKAYEEALVDVTKAETVANAKYSARTRAQNAYDAALAALNEAQRPAKVGVGRLGGENRYATNLKVIQGGKYPAGGTVFVASGADFPDALSAGPAAALLNAPLFLTGKNTMPDSSLNEIQKLRPSRVYVIGGTGAVSDNVVSQLRGTTGKTPIRVAGANRYQTSQKVFQTFFTAESFDSAFVATGRAFPDALSASAAAGSLNAPVLLVDGTTGKNVPSATLLKDMGVNNVLIVGGNGAVNKTIESGLRATFPNVERLSGSSRYETSVAVGSYLTRQGTGSAVTRVWIATGGDFADALSAAVPASGPGQRLALSNGTTLPNSVLSEWIYGMDSRVEQVTLVGGTGALRDSLKTAIENYR